MTVFESFEAAGRALADVLSPLALSAPVVIGAADDGLAVARGLAERIRAPLGSYRVALLPLPWRPSVAFGAVTDDDHHYLDPELVADVSLGAREIAQIARERLATLHGAPPPPRPDMVNAPVVIVGHALTNGYRVLAAVAAARAAGSGEVLVAAPVAAEDAAARVASACRLVTLEVSRRPRFDPADFYVRTAAR